VRRKKYCLVFWSLCGLNKKSPAKGPRQRAKPAQREVIIDEKFLFYKSHKMRLFLSVVTSGFSSLQNTWTAKKEVSNERDTDY